MSSESSALMRIRIFNLNGPVAHYIAASFSLILADSRRMYNCSFASAIQFPNVVHTRAHK